MNPFAIENDHSNLFLPKRLIKKAWWCRVPRQFASGLRMPSIGHPCLLSQTYANYFNSQAISSLLWIQSFRYAGRGNPLFAPPPLGDGRGRVLSWWIGWCAVWHWLLVFFWICRYSYRTGVVVVFFYCLVVLSYRLFTVWWYYLFLYFLLFW